MTGERRSFSFTAGGQRLHGDLTLPADARGLVLFAHGSGSSRFSPRNRRVAEVLNEAGFATCLVDLLSEAEERLDRATGQLRFDVRLLAGRVRAASEQLAADPATRALPLGYFGASTGAAAALLAAAALPERVGAVVSRGGRPDLAAAELPRVRAPTLLIVGGLDTYVLSLNREALELLPGEKALEVIPGASHLFEEPGALERVAELARAWFERHLLGRPGSLASAAA
ncbi:MAG TPA: dienelactone hydrolase family protein [Gaiellaceae bacterium]|nr:dienelactone hydrolase family protein [Gaiellaceae bacterium]